MEIDTILRLLTLVVGFYMAWNIGANDVANAMGTSVGSGALTLKRAVFLASILEFSGAFFVGSRVSETIQKGIVNPEIFHADPMVFVIGMIGALLATGIWLQVASYFGLPVSTTHAIVGAVLGFGAVIGGLHAVHWEVVGQIVVSWILSPLLSGLLAFLLFRALQKKILYAISPLQATKKLAPYLVFFAFTVFSLSLLFDGLDNLHLDLSFPRALAFSLLFGALGGSVAWALLRKTATSALTKSTLYNPQQLLSMEKAAKHLQRVKLSSQDGIQNKVAQLLKEVKILREEMKTKTTYLENTSEYQKVEKIFVYLQIISACLVAFAHGANDVANAIGPVAAVFGVLHSKSINANAEIPMWLLSLGGAGIVIGLMTWGWRVIETIGKKITELTPTRGFSAEFSAACTILLASKLGLPISTTHALVGSVLGIGLARGMQALNLKILRDIALCWVITVPLCALLSILVFYGLREIFL